MREKISTAVSFAILAYIILVISGIIIGLSLEMILLKGIVGLLLIGFSFFLISSIMENSSSNEEDNLNDLKNDDLNEEEDLEKDSAGEFSPLNLTVLETKSSEEEE